MNIVKGMAAALVLGTSAVPPEAMAQAARMEHDIVYGHVDGMATVYDVSMPEQPNGAGVIYVISGGFLSTREHQTMIAPIAEPLVEAGFTVFHLRHPSTPRYMAPEIYEAIRRGVDHILEHASEFGVEPERVGILGGSTGGLLALLLATDVESDRAAARGERVAAVVAYMPVADMRDAVGNVRATPSLGFPPELAPALSPVDFVTPDDPPVFFVHGDRDTIVPLETNSVRLRSLFEAAGVPTDLLIVDAGHELFQGEIKARADRAVVDWFRRFLLD